jgi:hypothetical protein
MAIRKKIIYTETRIIHKTLEDKIEFESKLNEALKNNGYSSRVDYLRDKYRQLMEGEK